MHGNDNMFVRGTMEASLMQQRRPGMPTKIACYSELPLDFAALAKKAQEKGWKEVSEFLIGHESRTSKKIQFFLETNKFVEALKPALEKGDPDTLDYIFDTIVGKTVEEF